MGRLRGVKPEAVEKRLKGFWFGDAGSRKTSVAIQFPGCYLIDTEKGATNDQYVETLKKGGGVYFGTTDLDEIIAEVSALLTEKHPYRTLTIDPITVPYQEACDKAARELAAKSSDPSSDGTEFGRHKAVADRKMKRLCGLLLRLDMNVILTSHAKVKWEKSGEGFRDAGKTFDAYGKLDYLFDLVLETELRGTEAWAKVRKSRILAFPMLESFQLSYDTIADRYGRAVLERGAEPVKLASPEQVARLTQLVETVRINPEKENEEIVAKWLDAADATSFGELPEDVISKCIAMVEARVAPTPAPTTDKPAKAAA